MLAMTYDATTKVFNGYVEVADKNSVPANATLVKPDGIVQPYTWDGTKWTGQSESDFEAEHSASSITGSDGPTAEQQALTALAQQIADNDNNTQTYLQSLAQALTALATGTTKNGGNA